MIAAGNSANLRVVTSRTLPELKVKLPVLIEHFPAPALI